MAGEPAILSGADPQVPLFDEGAVREGGEFRAARAVNAPLVEVGVAPGHVRIRRSQWTRVRAAQRSYLAVRNLQGKALAFFDTANVSGLRVSVDAAAHARQQRYDSQQPFVAIDVPLGIAPHLDKQRLTGTILPDYPARRQGGSMENELVSLVREQEFPVIPVAAIKARVAAIHQLVDSVIQENVHFRKIPGTPKKSLWKPGAELICAMLRIGVRYETEDLSRGDVIHYRVRCIGFNTAGQLLGEGLAEASTGEEKYRWRAAICKEEFDDTPETHPREKYKRGQQGSHYKQLQIRTAAADRANTNPKLE